MSVHNTCQEVWHNNMSRNHHKTRLEPTCACRSSWTPCSDEADDAGSSCGASKTASRAYERWLYPFSYLGKGIRKKSTLLYTLTIIHVLSLRIQC